MKRSKRINSELSQLSNEKNLLLDKHNLNEADEIKLININTAINKLQKELFNT